MNGPQIPGQPDFPTASTLLEPSALASGIDRQGNGKVGGGSVGFQPADHVDIDVLVDQGQPGFPLQNGKDHIQSGKLDSDGSPLAKPIFVGDVKA